MLLVLGTLLADVFEIVHPKLCLHALHNTADKTAQSGSAGEFLDLARQDTFCTKLLSLSTTNVDSSRRAILADQEIADPSSAVVSIHFSSLSREDLHCHC